LEDWVWPLIRYQSQVNYPSAGNCCDQTYNIGDAILFEKNTTFSTSLRKPAEVVSTTRKIVVLVGKDGTYLNGTTTQDLTNMADMGCDVESLKDNWKAVSNLTLVPGICGNCWAVGDITFTTGIRYFGTGKYIIDQTIEAKRTGNDTEKLVGDSWLEYTIYMLSDIMSTLQSVKLNLRAGGNLTQYKEKHIHQSYTAMWTSLFPFAPEPLKLNTQSPIAYIQGKVDRIRVLVWLILHLLLPVSALIVLSIEYHSDCMRNTLADTTLGPLLTDVRQVLAREGNGITNLSYVTAADTKELGILQLNAIQTPTGNGLFALTKPIKKSAVSYS